MTPIKGGFPQGLDGTLHVTFSSGVNHVIINGVDTGPTLSLGGGKRGLAIWYFLSVFIDSGAVLTFPAHSSGIWVIIGCATTFANNGSISATGVGQYYDNTSPSIIASVRQQSLLGLNSGVLTYSTAEMAGGDGGAGSDGGANAFGNGGGGRGNTAGAAATLGAGGNGGDGPDFAGPVGGLIYGNNGNVASESHSGTFFSGGSGAARGAHAIGIAMVILGIVSGSGSVTVSGQAGGVGGDAHWGSGGSGGGGAGGSGGKIIIKSSLGSSISSTWTITSAGGPGGSPGVSDGSVPAVGNAGTNGQTGSQLLTIL